MLVLRSMRMPASPKSGSRSMSSTEPRFSWARLLARSTEMVVLPMPPFWPATTTTLPESRRGVGGAAGRTASMTARISLSETGVSIRYFAPAAMALR